MPSRARKPAWKERVSALLAAVKDVAPADHPRKSGKGSAAHRTMFTRYCKDLAEAKEHAEDWFQALIDVAEDETGDAELAEDMVRQRRPLGPVAHGRVIAVIREYWLKCDQLNQKSAAAERVAPEELLLGWLVGESEQLAQFLANLPFWPMGLSGLGAWL